MHTCTSSPQCCKCVTRMPLGFPHGFRCLRRTGGAVCIEPRCVLAGSSDCNGGKEHLARLAHNPWTAHASARPRRGVERVQKQQRYINDLILYHKTVHNSEIGASSFVSMPLLVISRRLQSYHIATQ
jgi:hypothetical protein